MNNRLEFIFGLILTLMVGSSAYAGNLYQQHVVSIPAGKVYVGKTIDKAGMQSATIHNMGVTFVGFKIDSPEAVYCANLAVQAQLQNRAFTIVGNGKWVFTSIYSCAIQ